MECLGRNLNEHCCWVDGKVCLYLEEDTEKGFRWTCGLRRELGSWEKVLADARYQRDVQPKFRATGMNCMDWPSKNAGGPCKLCGGGNDTR